MSVKLLAQHSSEFLSLKGGCTGSSKSTHVKIPHCWKSHIVARKCCWLLIVRLYWCMGNSCHVPLLVVMHGLYVGLKLASTRENLSLGFPTKRVSSQYPS